MTVRYELKDGLEYATGGETVAAGFIEMFDATYDDMPNHMIVKQEFIKAVTNINTDGEAPEKDGDKSGDIDGDGVIHLLYSADANMAKVFVATQELLRSSALVDGETKLTMPLLKKLSIRDSEGLMGCYIANFIGRPLLDGQ